LLALCFRRRSFLTRMYKSGGSWSLNGMEIWYSGGPPLPGEVRESDPGDYSPWDMESGKTARAVGLRVDWPLVAKGLDNCLRHHDEYARSGAGMSNLTLPARFRVIDVHRRRLVQMPLGCPRFVAFSYV
jgi:hypothetical protein